MPAPMLAPHPRLYLGPDEIARLLHPPRTSMLRRAREQVIEQSDAVLASPGLDFTANTHNWMLSRARIMQTRVVMLIARWFMTGQRRFRDCAVEQVRQIGQWQHWSWIAWRNGDDAPDAVFDLSYGENSATLALAFDLLHDDLSDAERDEMVAIAGNRTVAAFLRHTPPGKETWWFAKPDSNWNTVCAGGAGMLALAMREQLGRTADTMLARVERSIRPFFESLRQTDGGWPEGIGYWGYGFRYGLMYLLSHERATGQRHPLTLMPQLRRTLEFPLDFCPNGVGASFGDVNRFSVAPIHYAAAVRLGRANLVAALDSLPRHGGVSTFRESWASAKNHTNRRATTNWPEPAELLMLHPRLSANAKPQRNVARIYRGLDWAILADRMPAPRMFMSIRGGKTGLPHGHNDLLTFHCVVGDEAMILSPGVGEYLDTTFSVRRAELAEVRPDHKNTLFINGVGIAPPCRVKTSSLKVGGSLGFRLDATSAMGISRNDCPSANFAGRVFLMLPGIGFLIIDHIEMTFPGRVESRMHSQAAVKILPAGALLTGQRQSLRVAYASAGDAGLHTAQMATTTPGVGPTVLRWCTGSVLIKEATFATLLSPGRSAGRVTIDRPDGKKIRVRAARGSRTFTFAFTRRLRPA